MYIYMCVYVYIYTYVYMSICACVCVRVCMYIHNDIHIKHTIYIYIIHMYTVYLLPIWQDFRTPSGPIAPRHFLVDLAVPVAVRLVNHLLKLLVGHAFAQLLGHALQVFEADLPRFLKQRAGRCWEMLDFFWIGDECVFICLSACLPACLAVWLSVSLAVYLSISVYVYMCICLGTPKNKIQK